MSSSTINTCGISGKFSYVDRSFLERLTKWSEAVLSSRAAADSPVCTAKLCGTPESFCWALLDARRVFVHSHYRFTINFDDAIVNHTRRGIRSSNCRRCYYRSFRSFPSYRMSPPEEWPVHARRISQLPDPRDAARIRSALHSSTPRQWQSATQFSLLAYAPPSFISKPQTRVPHLLDLSNNDKFLCRFDKACVAMKCHLAFGHSCFFSGNDARISDEATTVGFNILYR